MRVSNNKIAFLAIMFMLISIICNMTIYQKTSIQVTGKATGRGYVIICLNHPPVLNEFPSSLTVYEGDNLFYDVNATDIDNATQNLTFYDDTSLFNISTGTGIINFTAAEDSNGLYNILIRVQDNSSCGNSNDIQLLVINIKSENVAPSITSYYPLGNPTITEEQTRLFNISYEDDNGDDLFIYWYLNGSLVLSFNDTSNILKSNYTFEGNYTNAGVYNVKVIVSDSLLNDSHDWILTVTDVNRPPSFIRTIKNQTWAEDSILYGLDLDDYSYDPDTEDTLSYSVNYLTNPHSIIADINENNVVTFSQPADWYGSENISFTVTDNHGASNTSNNITLTVYDVPETNVTLGEIPAPSPGRVPPCIEYWLCSYWSVCYQDGYMTRTCTDLSECGTEYYKPAERKECKYIASCFNGIQDGDETGTDCGGKCGTCPSCFDGTMNNGETGIDCGGPCPACPTCFDGIINGGEIGIDCGGACVEQDCCRNGYRDAHLGEVGIDCGGACKECEVEIEKPAPKMLFWIIILLTAGIIAVLSAVIYLKREIVKLYLLSLIGRYKKKETKVPGRIRETMLSEVDKLESEIELKPVRRALKELSAALRTILVKVFRIKYEFTYEDIGPVIEESKLKTNIKLILRDYIKRIIHITYSGYDISKEELILLIKELRIIVYLITKSYKEGKWGIGRGIKEKEEYKNEIEWFCLALAKSLCMLEKGEIEKAEKAYADSKEAYNKLSTEDKEELGNYIKRVGKEIELFGKKVRRKRGVKDVSVISISLMIILLLGSMDIFFGSNITGLSTFEEPNERFLINIKGFNIEAGEHFVYRIRGYDREEEVLFFSDDTKLFNISQDGVIDFTPTRDQLGIHHVTIIIKDVNYKTSFKDIVFDITNSGGVEYILETSTAISQTEEDEEIDITSELNETEGTDEAINKTLETNQTEEGGITQEINQTEQAINKTLGINQTEQAGEEIDITSELNETEGTDEAINKTSETNQTKEGGITQELNQTNGTSSFDFEQNIKEPENIPEQLSETFLKPLDVYVGEFELGSTAKFNLLVENYGAREIENAYFKILIKDNSDSITAGIQSTPINIAEEGKKEMVAYWDTENTSIGNYTGKLVIMYESKSFEYDIRMSVTSDDIQTEIVGVTGMVTAPSTIIKTQPYTDIPPILIWIILIIISIDIAWFLIYSKKQEK